METKEDKKQESRNKVQVKKQQIQPGSSTNEDAELLGFHSKPSVKPRERDDKPREKDEKPQRERGGKKKEKVVLNDDDFPSL